MSHQGCINLLKNTENQYLEQYCEVLSFEFNIF